MQSSSTELAKEKRHSEANTESERWAAPPHNQEPREHEGSPEPQASGEGKIPWSCLDDPDGPDLCESEPELYELGPSTQEQGWDSVLEGTSATNGSSWQEKADVARPCEANARHKRLTKKTQWNETEYGPPVRELVTRAKARGLKRKANAAAKEQRRMDRIAEIRAWSAAEANIEAVSSMLDSPVQTEVAQVGEEMQGADFQKEDTCKLHPTHKVLTVGQTDAIYCTRCAAYSSRANLKKLNEPCQGEVPKSSSRNYRLLQLGLLPGPGVKIPPAMLRKRRRCW